VVDPESSGKGEAELTEILISKAKEIGADGVIILNPDTKSTGAFFPIGDITFYQEGKTKKTVRASAIVYEEE